MIIIVIAIIIIAIAIAIAITITIISIVFVIVIKYSLICSVGIFTITAEIYARSLVKFYCQYADRHINLKFMRRVGKRERAIRQFAIVKKQIDVSF